MSAQDLWKKQNSEPVELNGTSTNKMDSKNYTVLSLDFNKFKSSLQDVSERGASSGKIINIPNEKGTLEQFEVFENSIFAPSLAAKYPNIKSYVGVNKKTGASLRMSVSPEGVQTMVSYLDKPTVFMQPTKHFSNEYVVYNRLSRANLPKEDFICSTTDEIVKSHNKVKDNYNRDANDQTLRKFRIAISVNGEYTQFHGGTVAGALAAINATMTRVNAVFETDMAVTFILQDFPQLIYTDASTDPYSTSLSNWNVELQNTLSSTIGNAAYDIGHMFGASGGGGNAGCIGCVCVDDDVNNNTDKNKGAGITSPSNNQPQGDLFDIDYVAHEIGHQMGANHTFGFRTEGRGVNAEPGSGSTIMGYAGITSSNVQQNSDDYFHYHSIRQILTNLETKTCWQNNSPVTLTNNPPVTNAGADYSIPKGTAYVLKGSATDADSGDTLMYCWEQTDNGQVTRTQFGPTRTVGAQARSLPPTNSPKRYIPKLSRVAAGQLTETNPAMGADWETVSTVARELNWALTVRDRQPTGLGLGGQTSYDTMKITVVDSEPFVVSTPATWGQNYSQTITWNVGTTNVAPINCQKVNVLLSVDNGVTFPTILASNIDNNGSATITMPSSIANTDNARIIVEAADNIFYSMSSKFSINPNPDFAISNLSGDVTVCKENTTTYNINYTIANGFSETTTFSASNLPTGVTASFSPTTMSANGTVVLTLSNLNAVSPSNQTFTVTGTSTSITKNINLNLIKSSGVCASSGNMSYQTSTTLVNFNTINNVSAKPSGYSNYTSSISTNVKKGETHTLTVNVNTHGNYPVETRAWIDWNQNCSFDAGEEYNLGNARNVANGVTSAPASIVIPNDAVLGTTVLRVSTKYNTPATACQGAFDGEVEDYAIVVEDASASIEDFSFDGFNLYPNPSNGTFNLKFDVVNTDKVSVKLFDLRGRLVDSKDFYNTATNFAERLDFRATSGMYLIQIKNGNKQTTRKVVIK